MEPPGVSLSAATYNASIISAATDVRPRLRILCLHGFRQTATQFRGRTAALSKRLRAVAELVFIDAPHELPALAARGPEEAESGSWRQPTTQARKRRAWLVVPEQHGDSSADAVDFASLNDQQYHLQTAGWEESAQLLRRVLQEAEFDGVLGFSQGAGIAAALAALNSQNCAAQQLRRLKFVICCSGYVPAAPEVEELLQACKSAGGLPLPSLHVYGADAHDRQITSADAAALAQCFDPERQQLLRHPGGHFIPGTKDAAQQFLCFLEQFT